MSELDDIMKLIPLDQIAAKLGTDPDTARKAVSSALPALLGGMQANASDDSGAASLAGAVASKDPSLIEGGVSLEDVDTADGEGIVRNVFGENKGQIATALSSKDAAVDPSLVSKLLPLLAPIVMAFLAKKMAGGSSGGGGGIGDILGGILGGGGKSSGGLPGGLGDLLGGLLGGGKR